MTAPTLSDFLRNTLLSGSAALGLLAGLPLSAKDHAPIQPGKYEDWNGTINSLEIKESFKLGDYARVVVAPVDTSKTPMPDRDDNTYAPAVKILGDATRLWLVGFNSEFKTIPVVTGDAIPAQEVAAPAAAPAPAPQPVTGADGTAASSPQASATAAPAPSSSGSPAAPHASAPVAPAQATRVLFVRARVVELKPGSRAARMWIGMGAGKSRIELAGEVIDGASGKTLLVFDVTRTTSRSGATGIWALADPQDSYGGSYERRMAGDLVDTGTDVGEMLAQFK